MDAHGARRGSLAARACSARRLGVLGGSFDPPHLGHLHVARSARRALGLDHVVFVPAARPPHKPGRILAPARERTRMLELLLAGEGWASVWGEELSREGPSYTVDTVEKLRGRIDPGAEIFLLLGGDNLGGLAGWHRIGDLLALVRPVVVRRRREVLDLAPLERVAPGTAEQARRWLLDVEPVEASATEIRARLARGEDPGPALPAALREYVLRRGIYGRRDGSAP